MVYKNEEGIACTGCEYRSKHPGDAFGHTRCSVHRPCTGWKYWEPSNCQHCSHLEAGRKDLDHCTRLAYMGKLKCLLDKVQTKVGELNPIRDWQYIPIYDFTLKKFHFSQPDQIEQINV